MSDVFHNAKSLNGDLSLWDTSSVTNMRHMFNSATSFNVGLSLWDTSNVRYMEGMFKGARCLCLIFQDLSPGKKEIDSMES
jgi:surface protein